MPTAPSILMLALLPLAAGSVQPPSPASPIVAPPVASPARQAVVEGALAIAQLRYAAAARAFARAEQLTPPGDVKAMTTAQLALLGVQSMSHRFHAALATYQRADAYAAAHSQPVTRAALAINLFTVHLLQGDIPRAEATLSRALTFAHPGDFYYSRLLLQQAQVASAKHNLSAERRLYREALASADAARQNDVVALAWEGLGHSYIGHDELPAAADAFGQAVRWYRLARQSPPASALRGLGRLATRQGQYERADEYFATALRRLSFRSALPPWSVYYSRAQSRLQRHDDEAALADLRSALDQARRYRNSVLPSSSSQIHAEGRLQELYTLSVETGAKLLHHRGTDLALTAFTLQAAEENRAISLTERFLSGTEWETRLPEDYWETLAQYRNFQAQANPDRTKLKLWQTQLSSAETKAGLPLVNEGEDARQFLAAIQRRLGPDVTAFSFQLGQTRSFRWSVKRTSLQLDELPGRAQIAHAVDVFRAALARNDEQAIRNEGQSLYRILFDRMPAGSSRGDWLLSVDEALCELPFAALSTPAGHYLAEEHSLQLVPSLTVHDGAPHRLSGAFVAVADPILQPADTRFQPVTRGGSTVTTGGAPLLPRLPNSAREASACARIWSSVTTTELLQGADANMARLRQVIESRPAILHFSTHFITPEGHPDQGALVLSLLPNGRPALLGPAEVESLRVPDALVVLNGCTSGAGRAFPGAGWMGLSRSWLMAGAHNVAAAYWPVMDDDGQLWQEFYRRLSTPAGLPPAAALQGAQIAMLRSRTWRSAPRYWAAYFVTGKG